MSGDPGLIQQPTTTTTTQQSDPNFVTNQNQSNQQLDPSNQMNGSAKGPSSIDQFGSAINNSMVSFSIISWNKTLAFVFFIPKILFLSSSFDMSMISLDLETNQVWNHSFLLWLIQTLSSFEIMRQTYFFLDYFCDEISFSIAIQKYFYKSWISLRSGAKSYVKNSRLDFFMGFEFFGMPNHISFCKNIAKNWLHFRYFYYFTFEKVSKVPFTARKHLSIWKMKKSIFCHNHFVILLKQDSRYYEWCEIFFLEDFYLLLFLPPSHLSHLFVDWSTFTVFVGFLKDQQQLNPMSDMGPQGMMMNNQVRANF